MANASHRDSGSSLVTLLAARAASAQTLDIYFIDVEGGQSTLIVSPAGESLLVDTGYAGNDGRDPGRVLAAAKAAGIKKIDYLLITHFHADHLGGAPELSKLIPIGAFVDHDTPPPTTAPGVVEPLSRLRGGARPRVVTSTRNPATGSR